MVTMIFGPALDSPQPFTYLGVILKKSLLAGLFAAAGLAFATSSFAQAPAKMLPLAAEVIVLTATVDSVDVKKRIVVLKDANGNLAQMNVAKSVNDLDKVKKVVKVLGFVNCIDTFTQQPQVINGSSDFFVKVFGDKGAHTRSAVGTNSLPLGVPVEVEAIFEVEE
jgi:enamine deaminase RidA (YjgF/YER057c/UK114 family)